MAIIGNWGYGETQVEGNKERYDARYVGRMNKSAFIRTILDGDTWGIKWIQDRMGNTCNPFELELITKFPDKVVMYNTRTREIVKILDKY